jgi:hypothetical protein
LLTVTGASSNPTLVPVSTIVLGGTCHAKLRLEGVIRYPEISVDGQVLTRAGRILLDD